MGQTTRAISRPRPLLGTIALALLLVMSAATLPSDAQADQTAGCPELTDSIVRLHLALYGERPPPTVAHYWASRYQTGEKGLADIAHDMATSDHFAERYGLTSDASYISLVFNNVTGRIPTAAEAAYWNERLAQGTSRGMLALALAETRSFVAVSGTARPMAGFGRWYPSGTRWYCGHGPGTVSIVPLTDPVLVDYLAINEGSLQANVQFSSFTGDEVDTVIADEALTVGYRALSWDRRFQGDGRYGDRLNVATAADVRWAVVFYNQSIGPDRPGWQIGAG